MRCQLDQKNLKWNKFKREPKDIDLMQDMASIVYNKEMEASKKYHFTWLSSVSYRGMSKTH